MSFTVIIKSTNTFSPAGQNHNALQYLINWDFLPEGRYNMTFDFRTSVNTLSSTFATQLRSFTNITIDGLPYSNYTAGSVSSTQTTQQIGVAKWEIYPTQTISNVSGGILLARQYDNPPMYLPYRPSQNLLTVRLFQTDGTSLFTSLLISVEYVLQLHFTPLD